MLGRGILNRRLTTRRPSAAVQGLEQKARFVQEGDDSLSSPALFLTRCQSCFRHCSITSSSRCAARRCGFCWVKPSACSTRPTWSRWYRTPNRWWIISATRRQVHRFVRKPAAKGPARTICASSCFWRSESFGDRPRLGLAARASLPPWVAARFQRLTLDKWTPTSRATSVLLLPSCKRTTAWRRRASSSAALPFGLMKTSTLASGLAVRSLCRSQ